MAIVKVICRLPHGLIIRHPKTNKTVKLNGANSHAALNRIIPVLNSDMFGITEVDSEFWGAWVGANKSFAALTSKAIFVAKDEASAAAETRDLKEVPTGLEGCDITKEKDIEKLEH